jgi:MYXO-CTERM domain-containing protein
VPGTAVAVWTAGDAPGLVTMIGPASDFGTPAPARDTLPPTDAAPVAMLGALGLLGLVYAAFRLRRHRLARAPAPTDAATRPWFAATSAGLHEPDGIHHHD